MLIGGFEGSILIYEYDGREFILESTISTN